MKLTGAAFLVSRGMMVLQAAPAAYPYRSASGGRGVNESQPVARTGALLAFAGVGVRALGVRLFVRYPMWSALPFVAWGLAVAIALAWAVPAFRRAAFVPDAAARGGASQALGAAGGMALVGLAGWYVVPALDPE